MKMTFRENMIFTLFVIYDISPKAHKIQLVLLVKTARGEKIMILVTLGETQEFSHFP